MKMWFLGAALMVLLGVGLILLRLHPPGQLVLAAGPSGGAYSHIAEQYRAKLAEDGIELTIVETAGSVENAQLIATGQVDAALLQGGVKVDNLEVEAIGAIFYEPLVLLVRRDTLVPGNPALWNGLRINSGNDGSGTAAAFRDFEEAVGLPSNANTHLAMNYENAVSALAQSGLDIAVFVAPIDAPYLKLAYREPTIRILPLAHSEAISRRLEYATTVTLPDGAISLDPVVPPSPQQLLALKARLAIGPDVHPAQVNRLTMAAIDLHSARDVITNHGEFPSVDGAGMPINNAARQLILNGPSAWHDWLPYWMAAQINRVFLLMLPILFILVPALRAIPAIYAYAMRWRVWQHYPEIRRIEEELTIGVATADLPEIDHRLIALDARLSQIRVPPAYRQTAYDARLHIELVRKQIATLLATADA